MKDTVILVTLIMVLLGSMVGGGFLFGRRYEKKQVEKYLPGVMDGLCGQCNDIGVKEGEKFGYQKGIKTCGDVLNNMDDGGHY